MISAETERAPEVGESWLVRVGSWLVALLLGVVFGMLGTVVNQATISIFGWFDLPIGLIMACLASILLLLGLRLILPTRTLALLAAIGLVGIVAALTMQSPGGSVLIPANVEGYVWTFAPTVTSLVILAWPRRAAGRQSAGRHGLPADSSPLGAATPTSAEPPAQKPVGASE